MGGWVCAAYGVACYAVFVGTLLYAVGFVGDLFIPKSLDSGPTGPVAEALVVDALLLAVFAVQHSVMARRSFKRWWTRIVPSAVERSTYVLASSLLLLLLFWQWRPMTGVVWRVDATAAVLAIRIVFWLGWAVALVSTFLLDHFELFGLRQVLARLTNRTLPAPEFRTPLFYRHVRHPLYVGFLLAFWAAPTMTVGHLVFAIATTGYIAVGIRLEERDLVRDLGDRYRRYRERVGMLVPRVKSRAVVGDRGAGPL